MLKTFTRTLKFGRPYVKNLAVLSLSSLLNAGIGLVYLFILKNVVNTFFSKDLSHVRATLILSALLYILRSILSFFSSHLSLYTSEKITCDIKKMLFRHILRLPITYFKSSSEGAIMSKIINDTSKMQWLITGAPSSILGQPFKLAALFVIALWINVKLGLVLIFFLPLSYTVIRFSYKRISMNNKKILALSEQLYSFLEQKLYGLEIVKTLTMEKTEVSLYEKMNNEIFHADLRQYRSQAILLPAQNLLMGACVIFILWAGTGEVHSGIISPGSFAVFGAVAFSIYAILNKIGRTYTRFQIAYQSAERVFDILDLDCEPSGGISFPGDFMNIKISGLTFSYSKDIPVLNNISMNINRGETILINGPSGLGKTTVLRLLLRFYEPSAGEIRINNIPLFKYDISSLREKMNMVPQETILFNDTILNNIIYGSSYATACAVQNALKLSCCREFAEELEKGLQTETGDRGIKLSAGQKQRIAIARALLRKGDVLLLDEATSAVDEKTEKKILRNIINSKIFKTVVIVSHRSSMEKITDKIYHLDEEGIQLIKNNGSNE